GHAAALHLGQLVATAGVVPFFRRAREERDEALIGDGPADLPCAEGEDVRVGVLAGAGRAPAGVAERRAGAGHLVRDDADAHTIAADDDTEVDFAGDSIAGDRLGE